MYVLMTMRQAPMAIPNAGCHVVGIANGSIDGARISIKNPVRLIETVNIQKQFDQNSGQGYTNMTVGQSYMADAFNSLAEKVEYLESNISNLRILDENNADDKVIIEAHSDAIKQAIIEAEAERTRKRLEKANLVDPNKVPPPPPRQGGQPPRSFGAQRGGRHA